ncbi:hypothetical protein A2W70_00210 [Candidatus Curtissbacteria bacterium RIFCSPLOWO2_02_41_11]|uniref:Dienelactone hydrolase domain-containing protein n=1 Tax=Candidatus Curtissbacteria bacterium RIFCSPLOWO2_02_41_11 TaxID=1797731 RepID=A0A1F5HQ03_9BACT|nr:MAG: hypothetical protein A2W70_00210 [Candidatus Curtissbacteria bacterium RIFCSPLOWO2_02_41_11]
MLFWKRALLINIVVVLVLLVGLTAFFATPWGRPALKTALLVPEVTSGFPVKPLEWVSKEPVVSEVNLQVDGKEIKADLYRPQDNKQHPAVVFTLGVVITRRNPAVTKFAQALTRSGFVVLVPDLPDFLSGFIWTDSLNSLISSVEFLDRQSFVQKNNIGFAGFCVGASISIVASEDAKIRDKIAFIAAVSPYSNLFSLAEATLLGRQKIKGEYVDWQPAELTVETFNKGYVNFVATAEERELILGKLMASQTIPESEFEGLSPEAKSIYAFLANRDVAKFKELESNLPQGGRDLLVELSPDTNINNLKAKLFILSDKKDTFVPKIEGEKLAKMLPKKQVYFIEVDSFEHVNPATNLPRWSALKQLFILSRYLYNVLNQIV